MPSPKSNPQESGDYNPHRSTPKWNVAGNGNYFWNGDKNRQQFAECTQRACKILQTCAQNRRKKSPGRKSRHAAQRADTLFFVNIRLRFMKVRLSANFRNLRFAQQSIQTGQIAVPETLPTLEHF